MIRLRAPRLRVSHRTIALLATLAGLLVGRAAQGSESSLEIELEGGAVWQTRNDVEIPNDGTATRFSLVDLAGKGPVAAGRLYVTLNLARRHGIRALAAPFELVERGTPARSLLFAGEEFAAVTLTEATYHFNSWRLSYRYRILDRNDAGAWIGLTAKIRDAEVALRQGDLVARDTDVGFVPLLHVSADVGIGEGLRCLVDVDGLAGGPGRAIDGAVKIGVDVDDRWRLAAGYRTLEGGADVEEVYAFAWLHYAVLSLSVRL